MPVERAHFGSEIQERTGSTLRPEASVTNLLPPNVDLTDDVTSEEAVAIALWNNPKFQESLSGLGIERAKLAQAGQLTNPNFSILFPFGPKQLEFTTTFPFEALWLRPHRVALARLDAERISQDLVQGGLDLVRDVRVALADHSLAREKAERGAEGIGLQKRIAQIAESRRSAGEGTELEAAAANAEVNRAREDARRFEQEAALAHGRLLHLLGLTGGPTNLIFKTIPAPRPVRGALEDLEKRALAARPDLRASELAVEAAAKMARLAKLEWLALSGILDANKTPSGMDLGPGMAVTIPIFHQNQAGRTRAKAEVERAAWNLIGARQRVIFEVRQTHARAAQAIDALGHWRADVLSSLEELARGSEKAYELGELSPLAVQESARQLLAARVREAELVSEASRAQAELQRAVGAQMEPNTSN